MVVGQLFSRSLFSSNSSRTVSSSRFTSGGEFLSVLNPYANYSYSCHSTVESEEAIRNIKITAQGRKHRCSWYTRTRLVWLPRLISVYLLLYRQYSRTLCVPQDYFSGVRFYTNYSTKAWWFHTVIPLALVKHAHQGAATEDSRPSHAASPIFAISDPGSQPSQSCTPYDFFIASTWIQLKVKTWCVESKMWHSQDLRNRVHQAEEGVYVAWFNV